LRPDSDVNSDNQSLVGDNNVSHLSNNPNYNNINININTNSSVTNQSNININVGKAAKYKPKLPELKGGLSKNYGKSEDSEGEQNLPPIGKYDFSSKTQNTNHYYNYKKPKGLNVYPNENFPNYTKKMKSHKRNYVSPYS